MTLQPRDIGSQLQSPGSVEAGGPRRISHSTFSVPPITGFRCASIAISRFNEVPLTSKRVLVVDQAVPLDGQDATSIRMGAMLQIFSDLGHMVTFVPDNRTPFEPYTENLQQGGVEVADIPNGTAAYLEKHVDDFDVMIFSGAPIAIKYAPTILTRPDRPVVIFDTADLHRLIEARRAGIEDTAAARRDAEVFRAAELYLACASDFVWAVSPYEEEQLQRLSPGSRVEVVPMIHRVQDRVPSFGERRDLMFVDGLWHPANEEAVGSFVKDVLPLIRREIPGVRFRVVGHHVPESIRRLASTDVEILGHVPEIAAVFDVCRVFVAPLRDGTGVKGKITQSLALGVPVVTTTSAAEGTRLIHRRHALIADAPADLAAGVVELYQDEALWQGLSESGRRHVAEHFRYDAVKATLQARIIAVPARTAPRQIA